METSMEQLSMELQLSFWLPYVTGGITVCRCDGKAADDIILFSAYSYIPNRKLHFFLNVSKFNLGISWIVVK